MRLTRLRASAPVVRQTDVYERTDPVVVALFPKHIEVRLKGSVESYTLNYAKLLSYARGLACNGLARKAAR